MGNNTWDNVLDPHPIARGDAKNTFTAYQDVAGTAATKPLPMTYANELKVGTRIEIEARGEYSSLTGATLTIGAIYGASAGAAGGTALAQSGTVTAGTTPAAWPWHYNISGIITAVGTSGVIYCQGILDVGTSLTAVSSSWCPTTAAARSVTIDTTTAKSWGLGASWGASSASNTITVDTFSVHVLNQGKT